MKCCGSGLRLIVAAAALTVVVNTHADQRITNISTRGQVLTGDDVLIGGFIIEGEADKTVVIRARGPSLGTVSPPVPGFLADPRVDLYSGNSVIDSNDNWQDHERAGHLPAGLAPTEGLESAIVATLAPGPYTAIVRGGAGVTGVGIFEVFEVDEISRLANLSTRGNVGVGDSVMIAGLIVTGDAPKTVALRGIGPSFSTLPQPVPNELPEPELSLFSGADRIDFNADWRDHERAEDIPTRLQPSVEGESVVVSALEPGAYTAILAGTGGLTGNALVEVYELHDADIDHDLDGTLNSLDSDDDNDGFVDTDDLFRLDAGRAGDHDGDGVDSLQDPDDDGDGLADSTDPAPLTRDVDLFVAQNVGHPNFSSPHANPIVVNGDYVYVVNTPADTVDVISVASRSIVARINTGIDPVSVAVRPDGMEVWVSNHVSDSVSVIDTNPASATYHQVKATIQSFDSNMATTFDEPVGIAFASNTKAYVALSPSNRIAIIDSNYQVAGHLDIAAQDPRAIFVRGERLYVVPFESNNQSQLSGCQSFRIDGDTCTFDAVEHVFSNNNVLSVNYDADIVKNPALPDRDLFVYSTITDARLQVVDTVGTLLYGIAVDSVGKVYVTQTDARNVENGRAGTLKEGLAEMENRAFLNQITKINCEGTCGTPEFIELEPLPPDHPAPGMALATPFGIEVSADDATLVVTAAGSNKLFTVDAASGAVLGRVDVDAAPRGVALQSDADGAPLRAWVYNAVANTVSVVDLGDRSNPIVEEAIEMADPTHPQVKRGRIAFNDADASSTGTFSCESCHPDGHTDQLIWVLDTPVCDVDGCTQIPPRTTMPVRGLRDTAPYHWDGIPGDPYGGNNTSSINASVDPNCSVDEPESCTRFLVDGGLGTTMCDTQDCPLNDEGKPGLLSGAERDDMAKFLLSIPYPPSQTRPMNNRVTSQAKEGFVEFNLVKDCGRCHKMPFLVSTNTPGTGMDAPTWRGAYDRYVLLPQGRLNIADLLLSIIRMDDSFPERDMWLLAGANPDIWEMVVQGSTGFSGAFARQLTLNSTTATRTDTSTILDYLTGADTDGGVILHAEGVLIAEGVASPIALDYADGVFVTRVGTGAAASYSRQQLIDLAAEGNLMLTLTGRLGLNVDVDNPQPALWQDTPIHVQTANVEIASLSPQRTFRLKGRHIQPDPHVLVDGDRVDGTVQCEAGTLPACINEIVIVELDEEPETGGMYLLQVQNQDGLFSNDTLVYSGQAPVPPRPGNLIESGGLFNEWDASWETNQFVGTVSASGGVLNINVDTVGAQPWHMQLSHRVWFVRRQQYTLCYDARSTSGTRIMTAYTDIGAPIYANSSGGQKTVTLNTTWRQFSHTFTIAETDTSGRVAFDFAQSVLDVQMDNVGLYEGSTCGSP